MRSLKYIALFLILSGSVYGQIDRTQQPKPGPSPTVNIGKTQNFDLPNGLKVMVVENHKLPRVTFSLLLDNPPSLEGDLKGVDNLTSSMLGNGTGTMSKDEFNEQLDYYGAYVNFGIDGVSGNTLSKYFPQVLSLASQGVLDPLFTEEELNSEKAKLSDAIKANEKSTTAIANRVRRVLLYGKNHPKGEYLTEATINNVSLQDIRENYKKYFVPGNAYMVIVGDVKFDEVKKLISENFSSWQKAFAPESIYNEPVNLSQTEINFIDVPNAVQSEISINNIVNLKMTDPDFFAATLANYILGGSSDSYLFMNLREDHGWTYGAYSSIYGDKYITDFSATTAVRNAVTDSAVIEMLKEIKRIRTVLPTQSELDLAKAKYIGSFVMNAEKPMTIASFALKEKTQSLPSDFYENYIKNLNSVTLDQIQAAAKKYILSDEARIVIAGKASDVLSGLENLGIPINYFDKYGNKTVKSEEKQVAENITPKIILDKYLSVIGGKSDLEKINIVSYTAETEFQGQKIQLNKTVTKEGKQLMTISMGGMVLLKSVFDGETGYNEVQGNRQNMKESDLANMKKYGTIFPELKMLNSTELRLTGIENIEEKESYCLKEGNNAYYYSVDTGLKVAESVTGENASGGQSQQTVIYESYEEYENILFPAVLDIEMGMPLKFKIIDLKLNGEVAEDIFK